MSYFSIKELCKSDTAEQLSIKNELTEEALFNMNEILIPFLNKIREKYGKPINISSGYRCEELNKAVGGSPTSSHKFGLSADIFVRSGKISELFHIIHDMIEENELDFDQIIFYRSKNFIHVSPCKRDGSKRKGMWVKR